MKKTKKQVRMTLNRETLRHLDNEVLEAVDGAGQATITCPPTRTCDTCVPCV
jgi:hypothetical protein